MAFLSGIFGGGNQQQQPQPQQVSQQMQPQNQQMQKQPVQPNTNGSGGPAQNQMQGNANSQMTPNANPANPLDPFLQLMTPSQEVLQQRQQQQQPQSLFGQVDPSQFEQQVRQANFTAGLDQAKVQAALSGDANAFMEVLNTATQNAFSASIKMSQGLVEHGVKTGTDRFSSSLDSRFRDLQLKQQNPQHQALQHPAAKPMVEAMKMQIAQANPKMSPQDVQAQAEQYFFQLASQLTAKPEDQSQSQSSGPDWTSFLDNPQQ